MHRCHSYYVSFHVVRSDGFGFSEKNDIYTYSKTFVMRGSRNFRQGGPGQSDKKALTTSYSWSTSKNSIIFQGSGGGPTFSRGEGVQLFQGGGGVGSNFLFPIETHITCDFSGGSLLCAIFEWPFYTGITVVLTILG